MKRLWKERWGFHLISHFEECLAHVIVNCEFIFGELGGTFPLLTGLNLPAWGGAIMPRAIYLKTLKSILLYNCVLIYYFSFLFWFFSPIFFKKIFPPK
jgi:hypothetical protein